MAYNVEEDGEYATEFGEPGYNPNLRVHRDRVTRQIIEDNIGMNETFMVTKYAGASHSENGNDYGNVIFFFFFFFFFCWSNQESENCRSQ